MDFILYTPYPLMLQSCGPLLSQVLLSIFLRRVHISVPNQRQRPRAVFLGFWRRGTIELFLVDILTGWACGSRCWISCWTSAASYRCGQAKKSNWKSCKSVDPAFQWSIIMRDIQHPLSKNLLPVHSQETCRENRFKASAPLTSHIVFRLCLYIVKGNLGAQFTSPT